MTVDVRMTNEMLVNLSQCLQIRNLVYYLYISKDCLHSPIIDSQNKIFLQTMVHGHFCIYICCV